MASEVLKELRKKSDSVWVNLGRQLEGMEPYMERSDAPGEWTTREVLSHLLFQPGWNAVNVLKGFSRTDLPLIEIVPGRTDASGERRTMTLKQFVEALEAQQSEVFSYLDGLPDAELQQRKARIPLFKQFMGTDEIPIHVYVGALFDLHRSDHAGQLAKIRKAVGLPDAK